MKNKKAATSKVIWFLAIGITLILGIMAYALFIKPQPVQTQQVVGGTQVVDSGTAGGGGTIVTTNPAISIAGYDAQEAGTSVSASTSSKYQVNGGGFATVTLGASGTTAVPGQTIDLLLVNDTAYHDQKKEGILVTPSTFPIGIAFNKNATITENLYTTTGLVLTNSNTAPVQNQTDLGNGGTYNLKDEMTANALASTQDMTCIVEVEAGTNVSTSSPVMYGGKAPTSTAKPTWYSYLTTAATATVYQFDLPAVNNAQTVTNTLYLSAKSTGRFSAGQRVVKSCYTKEHFIDASTGKLAYDVADSLGTMKSMAGYRYTFFFQ